MANDELNDFLNRLLPEMGDGGVSRAQARRAVRAALAQTPGSASIAEIASRLDAAPDAGKLADDPDAIHELDAAQAWLDKVEGEQQPVPATLLRLADIPAGPDGLARSQAAITWLASLAPPSALRATPPVNGGRNRRARGFLFGGGIAAVILAGVTGYAVHDLFDGGQARVASTLSPLGGSKTNQAQIMIAQPAPQSSDPAAPVVVTSPNMPVPINSHAVTVADYPPVSVQLQEQGKVMVTYQVLKDGSVGMCQVERTSGFRRLDDAACARVKRWRFRPATVLDGAPVEWWLNTTIVFQLSGGRVVPPLQPPEIAPVPLNSHAVTVDDYPPDSIHAQEQGRVDVIYLVQNDGTVGTCRVESSSGFPRLDDAACTLVKRWRFKPAMQDGKQVAEYLTAAVVFQLK